MADILILSSWVGAGSVGLSASVPTVQALGHTALQLPTVMLSNHPGWAHRAGHVTPAETIEAMLEAFEANGFLSRIASVLIGYLAETDHVDMAARAITRVRALSPCPKIIIDPVLGDDPGGLYIAEDTAQGIRDRLLPMADIATPNRFELSWLTGHPVDTLCDVEERAQALRDRHGIGQIIVTSAPVSARQTGVLEATAQGSALFAVPKLRGIPHGTGDAFAALIAAGLTCGQAMGHLDVLVAESAGQPHLQITEAAPIWTAAAALRPQRIEPRKGP